jgi:hypothetical protein
MGDGKQYTDKQMALILRRAAELQRAEAPEKRPDSGYSLAELETAGGEAGIDPAFIRRAAGWLDGAPSGRAHPFLGAPTAVEVRAALPAVYPDAALEDALDAIPDLAGCDGDGQVRNGKLGWKVNALQSYNSGRTLKVSIEPGAAGSAVVVKSELKSLAAGLFGGVMGGFGGGVGFGVGFGVGLGELHSPAFAASFAFGAVVVSYVLARGLFAYIAGRTERSAVKIRDGLVSLLERSGAEPPDAKA